MKTIQQHRFITFACIALAFTCIPTTFAQDSLSVGTEETSSSAEVVTLPMQRTLTSSKGRKLEVMILSSTGEDILVKRQSDGKTFNLPLAKLSAADQEFVATLPKSAPTGKLFINVPDRATQLAQITEYADKFLKVTEDDFIKKHLPVNIRNAESGEPLSLGKLSSRVRSIKHPTFQNVQKIAFDLVILAVIEKEEKALIRLFNLYKTPESIPAEYVDDCYVFTKYHAQKGDPHAMLALGNVANKGHNRPAGFYKNQTEEEAYQEGVSWVKKAIPLFKENNDKWSHEAAQRFLKYEEATLIATHKGTQFPLHSFGPRDAKKVLIIHNSCCSGSYSGSSTPGVKTLKVLEPLFNKGWRVIAVIHPTEGVLADNMRKVDEIRWNDMASRKTVESDGFGEAIFNAIKRNRKFEQFSFLGHGYGAGMMLWDIEMVPQNKIHSIFMIRPTPAALPSLKNLKTFKNVYLTDPSKEFTEVEHYEEMHNHPGIRKWYKEQIPLYSTGMKEDGSYIDWAGLVKFLESQN